ncbi:MAG: dihydrodipicolinate reductase [Pseudomonadota bacterium]
MRKFLILASLAVLAAPAMADGFAKVQDRDGFVELIEDRKLTRFGINLTVTPNGQIKGKAFGRPVTGAWEWNAGYFCRDLFWGKRELGGNCQEVKVQGETIRFTSDKGNGRFADLVLE